MKLLNWVDANPHSLKAKIINQAFPIAVCAIMFLLFVGFTMGFITYLINPFSHDRIPIHLFLFDMAVGFFLYFITAVDYALIIGRMQVENTGIRARFTMNVFTCLGCFAGVSFILFIWGFAKEISWLIIALLIFAGCVMVKLAYEGMEYFKDSKKIWYPLRVFTVNMITVFHNITQALTFWIPELASPDVKKMKLSKLALWSFLLPFIIGIDDFVGYMGAMTIYNVFSLIFGIYLADVVIDILIFISPNFTKKMVQSALLSFLATYAFLYLMYKSFSEAGITLTELAHDSLHTALLVGVTCILFYIIGRIAHYHHRKQKHLRKA